MSPLFMIFASGCLTGFGGTIFGVVVWRWLRKL
jgi:hypothetical protein